MHENIEKVCKVKNEGQFDSETLETLMIQEEEILLQHLIDDFYQHRRQAEKWRNVVKAIQDHLKQRKG